MAHSGANMFGFRPELAQVNSAVHTVFIPAGNACDVSRSLYGGSIIKGRKFLDVMKLGEAYMLNGIEVTRNTKSEMETRRAIGYVGVGYSAKASAIYADDTYRSGRQDVPFLPRRLRGIVNGALSDVRDGMTTLRELIKDEPFRCRDSRGEFVAHEMFFGNLQHFAKVMRLVVDNRGGSVMTEFDDHRFIATFARRTVTEALARGLRGEPTGDRRFRVLSPTFVQFDGEAFPVAAETDFHIRDRPDSVPVLGLPLEQQRE